MMQHMCQCFQDGYQVRRSLFLFMLKVQLSTVRLHK